jgi:hypothetical protein
MRTYVAGAFTTSCGGTNYGASDGRTINTTTYCVHDDFDENKHKVRNNGGAAWEM